MRFEDDDLGLMDRRIEQAQRRVAEQRDRMTLLRANGSDTEHSKGMLEAFETNLKLFEENRQLLVEERNAQTAKTLARRQEALAQLRRNHRARELGETLRARLSKLL